MSQPISINVVRNWWLKFLMKVHRRWGLISSNRETVKRYFHFDGLGNTVALTDSSGDVQDTYVWTAFGLPLSSTGSSVNPYRYVGQWGYYDDGAMGSPHDFVLCGVRYYAPRYGRFLTWDPIGERGYGYCGNSATMAVDPDGRRALICWRVVLFSEEVKDCHWYFVTDQCGAVGFTKDLGIIWGIEPNIGGELFVGCKVLPISAKEEKCICNLAKNAAKGWKMCGRTWKIGDYNLIWQNCQGFVNCILGKCSGLRFGPTLDEEIR